MIVLNIDYLPGFFWGSDTKKGQDFNWALVRSRKISPKLRRIQLKLASFTFYLTQLRKSGRHCFLSSTSPYPSQLSHDSGPMSRYPMEYGLNFTCNELVPLIRCCSPIHGWINCALYSPVKIRCQLEQLNVQNGPQAN